MDKLRSGIVGTNFISKNFIRAEKMVQESEVLALYTRKYSNREKLDFSQEVKVYTDFQGFSMSDLDWVYLASPNACHKSQSLELLKQGKHVLCEKPIASNEKELLEMLKLAASKDLVLLEAMRPLFHPSFKVISEGLKKIGKLHMVDLRYCQYSSRYDSFKKGIIKNAFNKDLSNGAIMDIGVYPIEVMVALFGEPTNIQASGSILKGSIDVYGHLIATYEDMTCYISYSKVSNSYLPCEYQGEEGSLFMDKIACPSKVWIKWRGGREEVLFADDIENDMTFEINAFIKMITNKKKGEVDIDLQTFNHISLQTIKVIDEARKEIGIVFPAD